MSVATWHSTGFCEGERWIGRWQQPRRGIERGLSRLAGDPQ